MQNKQVYGSTVIGVGFADADMGVAVQVSGQKAVPILQRIAKELRQLGFELKVCSAVDLVKEVKRWANAAGVTGARDGHLSSYALILMVIYSGECRDVFFSFARRRFGTRREAGMQRDSISICIPCCVQ